MVGLSLVDVASMFHVFPLSGRGGREEDLKSPESGHNRVNTRSGERGSERSEPEGYRGVGPAGMAL